MKISDFIFRYPTFNKRDGICRIRIFTNNLNIYVVMTDIGIKNMSASVTNSVERIVNHLITVGYCPCNSIFIEHYEKNSYLSDTFDLVTLSNKNVNWEALNASEIIDVLGCEEYEFETPTSKNMRLIGEIDKLRYLIEPSYDFPYRQSSDFLVRVDEINRNKIGKNELLKLIEKGSIEQELSRLLKSDLSFFAEVYADPKDEYICFSEFPFGEGKIDYVVFTGRSRMEVYFIEIKGADFNFLNSCKEVSFNKNIDNAIRQVENRLGVFHKRYEENRQLFHRVRTSVENGEKKHNSVQGPYLALQVDPNKDVKVYAVIIGGRTQDDFEESRIRNDFEHARNFSIKLETWDSWYRKLTRA